MSEHETVALRLPAQSDSLPLARVVAVSSGMLANLSMDRIDDLRQCTQESLAVLLEDTEADDVELTFDISPGRLAFVGSTPTLAPGQPDPTSFAWLLLTELADSVSADLADGMLVLSFVIIDEWARYPDREARP